MSIDFGSHDIIPQATCVRIKIGGVEFNDMPTNV
jgi:hypothetical protein